MAPESPMNPTQPEARHRISHAAFQLFGQKGYSCTSVQEIADAAGVKKSIVYYYFTSKEGLYQSLVTNSAVVLREGLQQALLNICSQWRAADPAANESMAGAAAGKRAAKSKSPPGPSMQEQLSVLTEQMISMARENRDSVRFFLAHIFSPDADRPPCNADDMDHVPRELLHQTVSDAFLRGELKGDPTELLRLIMGAIQYSIIRHLRSPEQEPLEAGLGVRIVSAAIRGFLPPPKASGRRTTAALRDRSAKVY